MFVPMTAHCPHISVQVQVNDYLRSLSRVTVLRLFTYASNVMRWPHSPPSSSYVTNDRTVFPGGDISSAPNWIKVKCHTLWHGASILEFIMSKHYCNFGISFR